MNTKKQRFTKLAPVSINGITVPIDTAAISKDKRTVHHGQYKSVQVNSPETCQIGDSVVIWPESGKAVSVTMSKAALGVLATQYLESEGHTVTLKV